MRSRHLFVVLAVLAGCQKESAPSPASSSKPAAPSASSVASASPPASASAATAKPTIQDLDLEAVKKTVGCPGKPTLSACRLLDTFASAKTPEPFAAGTSLFFGNSYEMGFGADGQESMTSMHVEGGRDGARAVMSIFVPGDPHASDVTKKLLVSLRAGETPSREAKGFLGWLRTHLSGDPVLHVAPTLGASLVLDDPRGAHVFLRVDGARVLVINYAGGEPIEGGGSRKCMLRIAELWKV
jgi:hypothetical protein